MKDKYANQKKYMKKKKNYTKFFKINFLKLKISDFLIVLNTFLKNKNL